MKMELIVALIPLMPLLGFLVLGAGFRTIPRKITAWVGPGVILASLILALVLFFSDGKITGATEYHFFTWISAGELRIPVGFLIDPLSLLMIFVVTGVGFIIHVYSVGYMKDDPGFNRFFAFMNLFVFSMLLLVMGNNYPMMFIGWEGVGLCSYLLIGFWFRNQEYNNAAKKAFIMNRIGDLGFLLGMFLLFTTFHTLDYQGVFSQARFLQAGDSTLLAITLLLFVGAVGKSAQIPLYTWLPDAMAGPTPVSALIHAATMVTAGVYMVARSNILYVLSPVTMTIIAVVALATILLAASIAVFQKDIKKILAWSTISQLGYMFLALSVGAFSGAMFHLTTHAFFKALLFLAAGSVIHALGGEQDIRKMGGLRKALPVTWLTFLTGTVAISGIPPLSGFFSKDEILMKAFGASNLLWLFAWLGALLTAFYMFRMFYLVFSNQFRGTTRPDHPLHESPLTMTLPLMVLAFLSFAGGALNLPGLFGGNQLLEHFLAPVFGRSSPALQGELPISHTAEWLLTGITLAGVLLMILWAWRRYAVKGKGLLPDEARRPLWIRIIVDKYRIDELYDFLLVKPCLWLSRFLHDVVELRIIDRMVNGIGQAAIRTGNVLRYIQTGNVGFYLFVMVLGVILIMFFNLLI